jgi:hypothetical protein
MKYLVLLLFPITVFAMDFVAIPFNGTSICVSTDYYSVNGVRIPVTVNQALAIAKKHHAKLPTKEIVDAIWKHADLKLKPKSLPVTPDMTTDKYIVEHNNIIDSQIKNKFRLVAGHKKDILVPLRENRITIYGWHRLNGNPIQPVSNVHHKNYKDYSHGLRLWKEECE